MSRKTTGHDRRAYYAKMQRRFNVLMAFVVVLLVAGALLSLYGKS